MKQLLTDVAAFQQAYKAPCHATLQENIPPERITLRLKLVFEEFKELLQAHGLIEPNEAMGLSYKLGGVETSIVLGEKKLDMVEIADAIADQIYVLVGMALEYGIPLDKVWAEVQRSNMAKFPGGKAIIRESDGKVMKPNDWTPPDIKAAIEKSTEADWTALYVPAIPDLNLPLDGTEGWFDVRDYVPRKNGYYWAYDSEACCNKIVFYGDLSGGWRETDIVAWRMPMLPIHVYAGPTLTVEDVKNHLGKEPAITEADGITLKAMLEQRTQYFLEKRWRENGIDPNSALSTDTEALNARMDAIVEYLEERDRDS